MKPIDTVIGKLEKVKQSNGGWTALCPAHEDRHRSLSVSEGKDKVLLYCHAGCEFESIVDALGMKPQQLFSDNGHKAKAGMNIVNTYDYVDEDGKLLYQTVRLYPKDFRQRQPDGSGWKWTLKGVDKVLYHLDEIVGADTVFICEGEKSADAVRGLGLTATTSPMGAGKWRNRYSECLEGKDVIILPDADDQGKNHAADIANAARRVAKSVKVVHLPSVTDKSDPYDWIEAGGDKDTLLELVDRTMDVSVSDLYWDPDDGTPQTQDYINALNALGYYLKLDVMSDRVEVNGKPITDILTSKIKSQMRDLNYRHVQVMQDAWEANAFDNSYHPVQEWLESLEWDGEDHIGKLASYFEDENDYFHTFFYRWTIGAVARAYERTQNRMLVLDGPQNVGKSYFVAWLAEPVERPELFIEGPIDPDDKDDKVRLISTWVWEVSELGSTTKKADRESLKYFLSMRQVTVRKPYGHYDLVKPALSSFIGTVNNESGFLDDPTGYRRFMSVHVEDIDWNYAEEVDAEQLWAQAKALYDAGEQWELTDKEKDCAQYANEQYEMDDPLHDIFFRHYEVTGDKSDFVSAVDIRNTLNENNWSLGSPRGETMEIASMLKKIDGAQKARKYNSAQQSRERGFYGVKHK